MGPIDFHGFALGVEAGCVLAWGFGYVAGLRFPSLSIALTPKKKLSFDIPFIEKAVTLPTGFEFVQTGDVVSRQTIS